MVHLKQRKDSAVSVIESLTKSIAASINAASTTASSGVPSAAALATEDLELERDLKKAQIAAAKAQELYYQRLMNNA